MGRTLDSVERFRCFYASKSRCYIFDPSSVQTAQLNIDGSILFSIRIGTRVKKYGSSRCGGGSRWQWSIGCYVDRERRAASEENDNTRCANREIVWQLCRSYIRLIKWGWLISNCLYARRWSRRDWRVVPRWFIRHDGSQMFDRYVAWVSTML